MKKSSKNKKSSFNLRATIIGAIIVVIAVGGYFAYKHIDRHTIATAVSSSEAPLIITRSNPLKQSNVSNFTKAVSSQQIANTILTDAKKLSIQPSGIVNCPIDDGVIYILKFSNPVITIRADTSGCKTVTVSSTKTIYTTYTSNNAGATFWNAIAKATGQPINPSQNNINSSTRLSLTH